MIRCGAGDVYLYVDGAEIKQVCYEIIVSKEKKKKGMCVAGDNPARRCNPRSDRYCFEGEASVY